MPVFLVTIVESLTISDSVDRERNAPDLGIAPKQVKALLLNQSDDRTGVKISWLSQPENVEKYNVWRKGAIVLATPAASPVPIVDGDTLTLSVRGGPAQTITFGAPHITSGAATLPEIVNNLNAFLEGAVAAVTQNGTFDSIYIRCSGVGAGASIEILGGTAIGTLGFPTGVFSVNENTSEAQKLIEILHPGDEYEDRDGSNLDSYFVEAVNPAGVVGQTSVVKSLQRYVDEVPNRVIVWGLIFDAGGEPLKNVRVIIKPPEDSRPSLNGGLFSSSFGIGFKEHMVKTDEDGYFETEAIAGVPTRLIIDDISYDNVVQIPTFTTRFTNLSVVAADFRNSTTNGVISGAAIGQPGMVELRIGDVFVVNEGDDPIPIYAPNALPIYGSVQITNFPPGSVDPATETTLAALSAKFVDGNDIGDVTINNLPGNPIPITAPSPIPVTGTVDIGSFPDPIDVNIVSPPTLDVDLVGGASVIANIGSTGGLALESTLAAINAKLVPATTIGTVLVGNGVGALSVPIRDGGNSITVDGGVDILNEPPVNLQDGSGTPITSTTSGPAQALDVFIQGGAALTVSLDHTTDDVLIYGWDGGADQKVKTNAGGELQVGVTASVLPAGAATQATLASIDGKIPSDLAREHLTAVSPHAVRLTDGTAFYKATTPSDIQPVSIDAGGNAVDATIVNEPFVRLKDGAGNALTSSLIGADQALDVNVVTPLTLGIDHTTHDILIYGFDGALNKPIKTNALGQQEVHVVGSVLPLGAATETTLASIDAKTPPNPALDRTGPGDYHSTRITDGTNWLTSTLFSGVGPPKWALDVNILGGSIFVTNMIPGDFADLDSGAGTDEHIVFAIGLPAPGGHVIGGTSTDPLRIDPTGTTPQPVTIGASGDYYSDDTILAAAVGGVGTLYSFGFTAQNITIINDETTGGGAKDIEFSFDGFTTVHGVLRKGEAISMDNRRRGSVSLRSVGSTRLFRLIVWG